MKILQENFLPAKFVTFYHKRLKSMLLCKPKQLHFENTHRSRSSFEATQNTKGEPVFHTHKLFSRIRSSRRPAAYCSASASTGNSLRNVRPTKKQSYESLHSGIFPFKSDLMKKKPESKIFQYFSI